MTYEDLNKRYEHLITRVTRMRVWQKEVDIHHCSAAKETKRRMEREIDNLLKQEMKILKSQQKELF